jgi:hypothetical protein
MAAVNLTLYDIGGGHLAGKNPQLIFTLNDAAATAGGVYVTEPIVVTPGSDGSASFDLPSTDLMRDDNYYSLAVKWQGPAGESIRVDYPDWKIQVPTGGGNIVDLRGPGTNMSMVYVSLTPPDKPLPRTYWWKTDPDDITNPANTGKIYRWENI